MKTSNLKIQPRYLIHLYTKPQYILYWHLTWSTDEKNSAIQFQIWKKRNQSGSYKIRWGNYKFDISNLNNNIFNPSKYLIKNNNIYMKNWHTASTNKPSTWSMSLRNSPTEEATKPLGVCPLKTELRHPCLSTLPVKTFPHKKGSQGMEDGRLRAEGPAITCEKWEMGLDNCITKNNVIFWQRLEHEHLIRPMISVLIYYEYNTSYIHIYLQKKSAGCPSNYEQLSIPQ